MEKKTGKELARGIRTGINTVVLLAAFVVSCLMLLLPPAPAVAAGVTGEPAGPPPGSPMRGRGQGFERMIDELKLTPEQREKIKAIRQADQDQVQQLFKDLAAGHDKLRAACEAETFDEAAVRSLAEKQSAIHTELIVIHARQHSQIYALLTPEQREKAAKLRDKWGRRDRRAHTMGHPAGPPMGLGPGEEPDL